MKLFAILFVLLLLIPCSFAAETKVPLDRLNWSQSFPSDADVILSSGRIVGDNTSGINVLDYGAVADGITDDYSALSLAAADANTQTLPLIFPPGTYALNGTLSTDSISIIGYGAKLQQLDTRDSTYPRTLNCTGDNISIRGISIDGNVKYAGMRVYESNNFTIRDVTATNCVGFGIASYYGSNGSIENCLVTNIKYPATAANHPADGFLVAYSQNVTVANCRAFDFRRIGFVSDASTTTPCRDIVFTNDIAEYAHDCDDSATEYNAGFWSEHTNNVDFIGCIGKNLSGNAGQTSLRVRGMTLTGVQSTAPSVNRAIGCRLDGGAGDLLYGITISGNAYNTIIIDDCAITRTMRGVSVGNASNVIINDLVIRDLNADFDTRGAVVLYSYALDNLVIRGLNAINATYSADAGLVNLIRSPSNTNVTIENAQGGAVKCTAGAEPASIIIKDSDITAGGGTSTYIARSKQCVLENSNVTLRGHTGIGAVAGGSVKISDCNFYAPADYYVKLFGADSDAYISNNVLDRAYFLEEISGTCEHIYSGNVFRGYGTTNGAINTNSASPTSYKLWVDGCAFFDSDVPIQQGSYTPTKTLVTNCVTNAADMVEYSAGLNETDSVLSW